MKLLLFTIALLAGLLNGISQGKKLISVKSESPIVFAGVDRPGDLFIILDNGRIRKYNKDGKMIGETAPSIRPALFDTGDGTMSFAYFHERQEMVFFSPDMSVRNTVPVHPEFAIKPWLVCPSRNEVWILDSSDVSLKKTKDRISTIAYDVDWTKGETVSVNNITYMKEYYNFLFVLEKNKSIHILNNLGNHVKKIKLEKADAFHFMGEELYYLEGSTLEFVDLFTAETRTVQLPTTPRLALITDERMMLITGSQVDFYDYHP